MSYNYKLQLSQPVDERFYQNLKDSVWNKYTKVMTKSLMICLKNGHIISFVRVKQLLEPR